jgi:hypothetical protein
MGVFSMKSFLALGVLLRLSVFSASVAVGKQTNDDVGVNAVVHGYEDAWNRHDMDAFAMLYAPDADFVSLVGVHWIGRVAI